MYETGLFKHSLVRSVGLCLTERGSKIPLIFLGVCVATGEL